MSTYKYVKSLGFGSIIDYVNTGEDGVADPTRLNEILKHMSENGWKEVIKTKENIASIRPSTQIRYTIRDDDGIKFRTGGFFIRFFDQEDDPNLTDSYILYATHVPGVNRTLQYSSFENMYMKEKVKKIKVIKTEGKVKYKRPGNETNFPVYLKNEEDEDVVVYYAKNNRNKKLFKESNKYKRALEVGWEFQD